MTADSYRDYWLMEALANYSALLYLEKRKGPRAVDEMLDSYRTALLLKNEAGETRESAGPIVLGQRLQSSVQPEAWTAITYGKGSWIMQMLRRRMGDQRFLAMLSGIVKRYDHAIHHHRAIPPGGGAGPAAEIRRPEARSVLCAVGLWDRHPHAEVHLQREGRRARGETDWHADANRSGR